MFTNVNAAKAVTVLVPSGTEAYGDIPATYKDNDQTVIWGNGFRGRGWTDSAFTESGYINTYITLTIQNEASE
jgi:hypothetical protein